MNARGGEEEGGRGARGGGGREGAAGRPLRLEVVVVCAWERDLVWGMIAVGCPLNDKGPSPGLPCPNKHPIGTTIEEGGVEDYQRGHRPAIRPVASELAVGGTRAAICLSCPSQCCGVCVGTQGRGGECRPAGHKIEKRREGGGFCMCVVGGGGEMLSRLGTRVCAGLDVQDLERRGVGHLEKTAKPRPRSRGGGRADRQGLGRPHVPGFRHRAPTPRRKPTSAHPPRTRGPAPPPPIFRNGPNGNSKRASTSTSSSTELSLEVPLGGV